MDAMEGWRLIFCLENSAITSCIWIVARIIAEVLLTMEEPNVYHLIIQV